jgi:DNA-binding NtrC family response regulator
MINDNRPKVLLVDDDPALRESLQLVLKNDFDISVMSSGTEALEKICGSNKTDLDLILLDVMMPGIDGLELLKQLKSVHHKLPVIMVSASNTVRTAVEAMKIGAVDFVNKPFQIDELTKRAKEVIELSLESDYDSISTDDSNRVKLEADFGCLVGFHPEMKEVYKKVSQVAARKTTVLITGESGTGKELIARELHGMSDRKDKPFVAINCAAIPETLVESEFFGHEKGSFTHAVERRLGHFELADGGTIFLDEIGELIPSVQVKLLRVLQEREFYRVGRSKPMSVDVRVIAATNRSLEQAVQEGKFRQDLFFRINVVNIELPPLRKRKEDISRLINFFLKKLAIESY